ncbi:hypothetical protein BC828DRAFT_439469 [Blastocladiella britannica]|nr:hypothetical protein BC828DRAFT_439469 [Blastocladiella britannica]
MCNLSISFIFKKKTSRMSHRPPVPPHSSSTPASWDPAAYDQSLAPRPPPLPGTAVTRVDGPRPLRSSQLPHNNNNGQRPASSLGLTAPASAANGATWAPERPARSSLRPASSMSTSTTGAAPLPPHIMQWSSSSSGPSVPAGNGSSRDSTSLGGSLTPVIPPPRRFKPVPVPLKSTSSATGSMPVQVVSPVRTSSTPASTSAFAYHPAGSPTSAAAAAPHLLMTPHHHHSQGSSAGSGAYSHLHGQAIAISPGRSTSPAFLAAAHSYQQQQHLRASSPSPMLRPTSPSTSSIGNTSTSLPSPTVASFVPTMSGTPIMAPGQLGGGSFETLAPSQLYPYVLRTALTYDRRSLPASGDGHLHGGGALTRLARRLFGFAPNNKHKDPSYASVKLKADDKHLYRDLQLYSARLDRDLVPGRQVSDFASREQYAHWLEGEKAQVQTELAALAAQSDKITRKSKHGSSDPQSAKPLFMPPHADRQFAVMVEMATAMDPDAAVPAEMVPLIDALQARWRVSESLRLFYELDRLVRTHLTGPTSPPKGLGLINLLEDAVAQMLVVDRALMRGPVVHPPGAPDPAARAVVTVHERTSTVQLAGLVARIAGDVVARHPDVFSADEFAAGVAAAMTAIATARRLMLRCTVPTTSIAGPRPPRTQSPAFDAATAAMAASLSHHPNYRNSWPPEFPDLCALAQRAGYLQFTRILATLEREQRESLIRDHTSMTVDVRDPAVAVDMVRQLVSTVAEHVDDFESALTAASNRLPELAAARVRLVWHLLQHLFEHIDGMWLQGAGLAVAPVFEVYNTVRRLADIHRDYMPSDRQGDPSAALSQASSHLMVRYEAWFTEAVDAWIRRTADTMTEEWTQRMVAADQFLAAGSNTVGSGTAGSGLGENAGAEATFSTSVVDLFSALHQHVDAARSLPWPSFDYEYHATKLIATAMTHSLARYAETVQGQIVARLLQMEEAAMAQDAAIAEAEAHAAASAAAEREQLLKPKSLMNRLRASLLEQQAPKDKSVAGAVTRHIRTPVAFDEPLCVRLNNVVATKRRIDGIYTHVIGSLSRNVPSDAYVSPFPRDETLLALAGAVVELTPAPLVTVLGRNNSFAPPQGEYGQGGSPPQHMFWVELAQGGTPLGATVPTAGLAQHASSSSSTPGSIASARVVDLDTAVMVAGSSTMTLEVTVLASIFDGESVTAAVRASGSSVPTAEEREALAMGGVVVARGTISVDVRRILAQPGSAVGPDGSILMGVPAEYRLEPVSNGLWARKTAGRQLKLHVRWARRESLYLWHQYDTVYGRLDQMADIGLEMMASQISRWMQDYLLHMVKQYKVKALTAAFGGSEGEVTYFERATGAMAGALQSVAGAAESTAIVTFKTRAGKKTITFETVERDMQPLLDYLNKTLETMHTHLDGSMTAKVFRRVWRGALAAMEWQLVGRREKRSSYWKALDSAQTAVLRRALTLLYDFFYVDGEGLPRTQLQSRQYHRLAALLTHYLSDTDDLMAMYTSALNFYLAAKVEGIQKRAARRRAASAALSPGGGGTGSSRMMPVTMSRSGSLADFAKLVDVDRAGQRSGSSGGTPGMGFGSPHASLMDVNELANSVAHVGLAGGDMLSAPIGPAGGRERRRFLTHRRAAPARAAHEYVADAAASTAKAESSTKKLSKAAAKPRRFQYAAGLDGTNGDGLGASDGEATSDGDSPVSDDDDDMVRGNGATPADSGVALPMMGSGAGAPEMARAQNEHKLASLARQEAIWTVLCLRADAGNAECRDFVTVQADTVRRILDNMREELAKQAAASPLEGLWGR